MISRPKSPIRKIAKRISISKQMRNDYEAIASCYHEASHTIIALINTAYVSEVSIKIGAGGDTFYEIHDADETENGSLKRLVIMAELKMLYAGLIGEKIYYQEICGSERFPMSLKCGSYQDFHDAAKIIKKYKLTQPGQDTKELKQDIRKGLEKLLSHHWGDVKLLAHLLYKRKKLKHKDLKNTLTRNSEHKEFWREKFRDIKTLFDEDKNLTEKDVKFIITSKL